MRGSNSERVQGGCRNRTGRGIAGVRYARLAGKPLVYRLLHLDSAATVIIVRGLYHSLRDGIKAHQACRAPGDNVLFLKSPWELDEVGHIEGKGACGG